jgi:hypothetical protein
MAVITSCDDAIAPALDRFNRPFWQGGGRTCSVGEREAKCMGDVANGASGAWLRTACSEQSVTPIRAWTTTTYCAAGARLVDDRRPLVCRRTRPRGCRPSLCRRHRLRAAARHRSVQWAKPTHHTRQVRGPSWSRAFGSARERVAELLAKAGLSEER